MKGIKSLILGFFLLAILGSGHFAFADKTIQLPEVVVTAKRKPLTLKVPEPEINKTALNTKLNLNKSLSTKNESSQNTTQTEECKGVKLNTNLPFL